MPINKRTETIADTSAEDNVITMQERANDKRGVFDPTKDPLEESAIGALGADRMKVSGALRFVGMVASQEDCVPHPQEMKVVEILSAVRASRNPDPIEHKYRDRIRSPLSAVRAWCVVECKHNAVRSVNNCQAVACPLWPFRMGTNGMRGVK